MEDHLLMAHVLFDLVKYTSNKRPTLLEDRFLVAFSVVLCHRFHCNTLIICLGQKMRLPATQVAYKILRATLKMTPYHPFQSHFANTLGMKNKR